MTESLVTMPPGSTTVEIRLEPGPDGTTVRIVHTGPPGPPAGPHEQGWAQYVGRLADVATGVDGPDR
jgi:hypothetical protein